MTEGYKKIYLIRHGQAECNVASDLTIPDAVLTKFGRSQCVDFSQGSLGATIQDSAELILTSPLRRALSTTLLALPRAVERLLPDSHVLLVPQLQEINDVACDRGSDRAILESTPEYTSDLKHIGQLDFSPLTEDWNKKQGIYAANLDALWARAQWVRRMIRDREERPL
ncbi:histidine phosphatase family containing protein [Ceratobasidium sp. AG-Ba]|nr:histidine phosphatase family containing protein [Ceratobasidium sp. AG-Ba]